ncbi:hypothetical protein HispidOSU_020256 [Sigmodon hispidus]
MSGKDWSFPCSPGLLGDHITTDPQPQVWVWTHSLNSQGQQLTWPFSGADAAPVRMKSNGADNTGFCCVLKRQDQQQPLVDCTQVGDMATSGVACYKKGTDTLTLTPAVGFVLGPDVKTPKGSPLWLSCWHCQGLQNH